MSLRRAPSAYADLVPFDPVLRLVYQGDWRARMIEPWRRLFDCELVWCSQGEFDLHLGDETVRIGPGMVALIPPAFAHESVVGDCPLVRRHCLHFDWTPDRAARQNPLHAFEGDAFDGRLVAMPPPAIAALLPLVAEARQVAAVLDLLRLLFERLDADDPRACLLLWPVLRFLLAAKAGRSLAPAREPRSRRALLAAKRHLDDHYAEAIDYRLLCRRSGLSTCHFCTAFRQLVGRAPMQYLLEVRLAHGLRLLREGRRPVAAVAAAVGFPSANYFARRFRARFGIPPTRVGS